MGKRSANPRRDGPSLPAGPGAAGLSGGERSERYGRKLGNRHSPTGAGRMLLGLGTWRRPSTVVVRTTVRWAFGRPWQGRERCWSAVVRLRGRGSPAQPARMRLGFPSVRRRNSSPYAWGLPGSGAHRGCPASSAGTGGHRPRCSAGVPPRTWRRHTTTGPGCPPGRGKGPFRLPTPARRPTQQKRAGTRADSCAVVWCPLREFLPFIIVGTVTGGRYTVLGQGSAPSC